MTKTKLARRLASERMKALWRQPAFRAARSRAASQQMTANWRNPVFVDKQWRAAVRNWSRPEYRLHQQRRIIAGKRAMPLANAPGGQPCTDAKDGHPCSRRDEHRYHVAVVGNLPDATLGLMGWAS